MSKGDDLSKRQQGILDYVRRHISDSGRPPTIREIGREVQITSTSVVNYNLTKLTEKGFLDRDAEVSRGIRLTEKARALYGSASDAVDSLIRVPLLGDIVASEPVEVGHENFAIYDEDDAIELSRSMLDSRDSDNLFALRVRGNSMVDDMVNDGDIVIMRQQESASNGDMVAVWLTPSDTTTLKRIYHEGDQVRLQPANPTMEPIYVDADAVRVQGKVMAVYRNLV